MLSKLMPLLLEEPYDAGVAHLLWTGLQAPPVPSAAAFISSASPAVARQLHTVGGCLLFGLLRALFTPGFTVAPRSSAASGDGDDGNGRAASASDGSALWGISSTSMDDARQQTMTALIACASATLYVPPAQLARGDDPNRLLCDAINAPDPHGKALFRGLLSVIFSYEPTGWGIPFASAFTSDSHAQVMGTASLLLLVLLSQPPAARPSGAEAAALAAPKSIAAIAAAKREAAATASNRPTLPGTPARPGVSPIDHQPLDRMSRFLANLQKPATLDFLIDGFVRLLGARTAAERAFLPSAYTPIHNEFEIVLLLWHFLSLNRKFVRRLVACSATTDGKAAPNGGSADGGGDGSADGDSTLSGEHPLPTIVVALCQLALLWLPDPAMASASHLATLCLLLLSAEPNLPSAPACRAPTRSSSRPSPPPPCAQLPRRP